ncbi:MAG: hypothetical protein PHG48_07640 [Eubacteriales bacterium]|nr:hypothetical protein [Eubacteriales bacterium]
MEKKIITEEGRNRVIAACADGDYHQAIMDIVYNDWNAHNDALLRSLSKNGDETPVFVGTEEQCREYANSLPAEERKELRCELIEGEVYWGRHEMLANAVEKYGLAFKTLVQLGNYNYQVCNGGHYQYFDNGYASDGGGCFQSHDPECALHHEMIEAFNDVIMKNAPEEFKEALRRGFKIMSKFNITVDEERYVDEECDECSAYGTVDCQHCDGNGVVEGDDGEETTCPECGGSGTVKCSSCDGKGMVEVDNENYGQPDNLKILEKLDDEWYEQDEQFMTALNAVAKKLILG